MKVKWVTGHGYQIRRLLSGRCNVFSITYNGAFVVIDTSVRKRRNLLLKKIGELSASGQSFKALFLTHAHFDHAENAAAVAKTHSVPVLISKEELKLLIKGENPATYGVMGAARLINFLPVERLMSRMRYEPVTAAIAADYTHSLGSFGLPDVFILPTPGHSSGSVSVIIDNEIAIVGDSMHGVFPGNAWPPFAANENALLKSWGMLLDTGCAKFLPSHGGERSRSFVEKQYGRLTKKTAQ